MSNIRKDTVTLYIPQKTKDSSPYVRYTLNRVLRRYSHGSANHGDSPDHGMTVYIFDMDQGNLSFLKKPEVLEGYCSDGTDADGAAPDTDTPWQIDGIYKIVSVERYDTGSRWMAHWKLTCR